MSTKQTEHFRADFVRFCCLAEFLQTAAAAAGNRYPDRDTLSGRQLIDRFIPGGKPCAYDH